MLFAIEHIPLTKPSNCEALTLLMINALQLLSTSNLCNVMPTAHN